MEILALLIAAGAFAYAHSLSRGISTLRAAYELNIDQLRQEIERLRENGLSVADRSALDAVHDVIFRNRLREIVTEGGAEKVLG